MPPRVTLRDIGRHLGVSVATVSLALRDDPRIAAATRRAVQESARQLGYRPDPGLAALPSYRWPGHRVNAGSTVVLVTQFVAPYSAQRWPHFHATCRDGAVARAAELGYAMECVNVESPRQVRRLNALLAHRNARGLLMMKLREPAAFTAIQRDNLPVVAVGQWSFEPHLPHFLIDDFGGAGLALAQARRAGCTRIGAVIGFDPGHDPVPERRLAAARYYLADRGGGSLLVTDYARWRGLRTWLRKWRPDCVIGSNDAVYWRLLALGVRIPGDLSFVSLHRMTTEDDVARPLIAGLDRPGATLGRRAMEFLDMTIGHGTTVQSGDAVQRIMLMPTWRNGASLPGSPDAGNARRPRRGGPSAARRPV